MPQNLKTQMPKILSNSLLGDDTKIDILSNWKRYFLICIILRKNGYLQK